jgi:hypothetical protein
MYHRHRSVLAPAPDGSVYEAYCGYGNSPDIAPGHGFSSTLGNRRHDFGGMAYYPDDVFIGRRESGKLKPTLFFRDVGSHNTRPHALAVDHEGRCHLMVADVDIYQANRLHLYWLVGDPAAGKWTAAWLVDRRGFTSSAQPWSAAQGSGVHLLWSWENVAGPRPAAGNGIYYLNWTPGGFGRKVRVAQGKAETWDAALDAKTGQLLLVFSQDDGVFVAARVPPGRWARPSRLHPSLTKEEDVSLERAPDGSFIIRTHWETSREWVLRLR